MGPRLISRGVLFSHGVFSSKQIASMGPRLISRGVTMMIGASAQMRQLQWGRGSLAAACTPLSQAGKPTEGFNGAAAH